MLADPVAPYRPEIAPLLTDGPLTFREFAMAEPLPLVGVQVASPPALLALKVRALGASDAASAEWRRIVAEPIEADADDLG